MRHHGSSLFTNYQLIDMAACVLYGIRFRGGEPQFNVISTQSASLSSNPFAQMGEAKEVHVGWRIGSS